MMTIHCIVAAILWSSYITTIESLRFQFKKENIKTIDLSRSRGSKLSLYQIPTTLIQAPLFKSSWSIMTVLSVLSTGAIMSERTKFGAMLSPPVVATLSAIVLSNLRIIPSTSIVYEAVMKQLVPLAIPLLLFDADLKKCIQETGTLLKAFLVGTVGTIVGTFIAYFLVPMRHIPGSEKIAAALCARHIGGAVNFVAVSDILKPSADAVAASLAADNVVVAFYFMFLFAITVPDKVFKKSKMKAISQTIESASSTITAIVGENDESSTSTSTSTARSSNDEITLTSLSLAITLALLLYSTSISLSTIFKGSSPMIIVSLLTVLVATLFPKRVGSISKSGGVLGVLIMQIFFVVIGAMGDIAVVLKFGPSLFAHTAVQIIAHFIISVGLGKLLNIPFREIALASNANVGGPTTAAAMASSKRWNSLVLPALLTGVFGYAIATGLGLIVAKGLMWCTSRNLYLS